MANPLLLIGDIGGTNARFALVRPGETGFFSAQTLQCEAFSCVIDAIEAYLLAVGAASPAGICLAAAGPVVDNTVQLTNAHWLIDGAELVTHFGARQARILNDFEANAFALPALAARDCVEVGEAGIPVAGDRDYTLCVLGPGTGLGGGGLRRYDGHMVPVVTEAGHVGFAPETALQDRIWQYLYAANGHVSDEMLVSGPGFTNLFEAISVASGAPAERVSPAEIFRRDAGGDDIARLAVDTFFEILGQATSNLVFSLGAFDGAYLMGGILPRYRNRLLSSTFRHGFENKSAHRALLKRVPTCLVVHPEPGLLGASAVACRDYESHA
ncbi:MAG: glucokinase [Pseudomonadales bacterium]|nr:glucokinase [Pseudomonadales bacterium]